MVGLAPATHKTRELLSLGKKISLTERLVTNSNVFFTVADSIDSNVKELADTEISYFAAFCSLF